VNITRKIAQLTRKIAQLTRKIAQLTRKIAQLEASNPVRIRVSRAENSLKLKKLFKKKKSLKKCE